MTPNTIVLATLVRRALLLFQPALLLTAIVGLSAACSGEPTPTVAAPTPAPTSAAITPTSVPTSTRPLDTPTPTVPPTSTPTPTPLPTRTTTPLIDRTLVSFPEDEAPHETPIEWWYFNGFLRDAAGGEYSFHFVTFQSPTLQVGTPHLLQATLSDHGSQEHLAGERPTLSILDPDAPSVDIDAGGWVMRGDGQEYTLIFNLEGRAVSLVATSRREPVLHDSTGLVHLGEAGDTYYYSRTRLDLAGWIEDTEGRREVSGSGWMDHQWGDISRVGVGWDWVNLQLDDGSDLMVVEVWQPDTHERIAAYGTFVSHYDAASHIPGDGVLIEALGTWVSPNTGIEYPMGWRVEVEELDIELNVVPVLEQAEFAAGTVLPVAYWEGAVFASGRRGGAALEGKGFVELVGYDPGQATADIPMP